MFDLLSVLKKYKLITPQEAKKLMDNDKSILLIDVRTPEEYRSIHIPNGISVPLNNLKLLIEKLAPNKDTNIIVYCQSGARASAGSNELVKMGYTNISNLGGIMSWPFETVRG